MNPCLKSWDENDVSRLHTSNCHTFSLAWKVPCSPSSGFSWIRDWKTRVWDERVHIQKHNPFNRYTLKSVSNFSSHVKRYYYMLCHVVQ